MLILNHLIIILVSGTKNNLENLDPQRHLSSFSFQNDHLRSMTVVTVDSQSSLESAIVKDAYLQLNTDIPLTSEITISDITGLIIDGAGFAIDGTGMYRCFYLTLDSGSTEVEMRDLTITNGFVNSASTSASYGAAIYQDSYTTLSMVACEVSGSNTDSGYGGGISVGTYATLDVTETTFIGNAASYGGAIYMSSYSNVYVNSSELSTNTAYQGGGIYLSTGYLTMTDVNVTQNILSGSGAGGGAYFYAGTADLTRCSFTHHSGYQGAGIYARQSHVLSLTDYAFENNVASYLYDDIYIDGTISLSNGCGGGSHDAGSGLLDCTGCSSTSIADYLSTSCVAWSTTATVTTQDELQEAIMPNRTIELGADIYLTSTIVIINEPDRVLVGLVIDGMGVYSVDGGGSVRCFYVSGDVDMTLQNLIITSGYVSSSSFSASYGAAIYQGSYVVLNMISCFLTSGTASSGYGGGISVGTYATLDVTDTKFKGNAASYGGAIYMSTSATVSLDDSILTLNSAYQGGGIYLTTGVDLTGTDVMISENTATYGGGLWTYRGTVSLTRPYFLGNAAATSGGGIYSTQSAADILLQGHVFGSNSASSYVDIYVAGTIEIYSDCAYGQYNPGTDVSLECTGCDMTYSANYSTPCLDCDSSEYSCCGAFECLSTEQSCTTTETQMCPSPTASPTMFTSPGPTFTPTPKPTFIPSLLPTPHPTVVPTTAVPVLSPSPAPTLVPFSSPTLTPILNPTSVPLPVPSPAPTPITFSPTVIPTSPPTFLEPTPIPTSAPTPSPTLNPTSSPSIFPTLLPTPSPTPLPTNRPTPIPTPVPTPIPTPVPTPIPTSSPTPVPTMLPSTLDTRTIAVRLELAATDEPTSAEENKLRKLIKTQTGITDDYDFRDFNVEYTANRRIRRSLLSAGIWEVSLQITNSLADMSFSSADEFATTIQSDLSSTSFSASLMSNITKVTEVNTVTTTIIYRHEPTFEPTFAPTSQPTFTPTSEPTSRPSLKPTTKEGSSSSDGPFGLDPSSASATTLILGGGGILFICCIFTFVVARRRKSKSDHQSIDIIDGGSTTTKGLATLRQMFKASSARMESLDYEMGQMNNDAMKLNGISKNNKNVAGSNKNIPPPSYADVVNSTEDSTHLDSVILEPVAFAHGACGQIFKGTYYEISIAAKQVFGNNTNSEAMAEFDAEVAVLKKLSHPCIITCFGTWKDVNNVSYMVLEYCGGGTLGDYYLKPEFNNKEYIRVVSEMLGACSYLHGQKIAHRDLKPDNILLEAGTLRVKLADFGLARVNKANATKGTGTPYYMPPEMFNDDEHNQVNPLPADIFALGVIMWQLWFKQLPYGKKNVHQVIMHVMDGFRPPLSKQDTGYKTGYPEPPEALKQLINKCWSHSAKNRPEANYVLTKFKSSISSACVDIEQEDDGYDVTGSSKQQTQGIVHVRRKSQQGGFNTPKKPISKMDSSLLGDLPVSKDDNQKNDEKNIFEYLKSAGLGLEKYTNKFLDKGYTDLASICDHEICNDTTLIKEIGMNKKDVLAFRNRIAKDSAGLLTINKVKKGGDLKKNEKNSMIPIKPDPSQGTTI